MAPMHDVTDWGFWRLLHAYGGADLYFTEYFRVHETSRLSPRILRSVTENPTGRPVVAQIFGTDRTSLVRAARELQRYAVAGIDLNLGCPAPIVTRKGAGGGLLRTPELVDELLAALRDAVTVPLSVKTRLGFSSAAELDRLLPLFARHSLDLVTLHGRTVTQGYAGEVRYDRIADAVRLLPCPVLANGDVSTAAKAAQVLAQTGAHGLMIGRAAIANPWIFTQVRQRLRGEPPFVPVGRELLAWIEALFETVCHREAREAIQVERVKRCMNFFVDATPDHGAFVHRIRRVETRAEFHRTCAAFFDHDRPLSPAAS
jgi:nifR3 family TIM-barrel protein